ncbi:MAG TPA: DinB family protein [Nocardioidaceae bacterium]|nr:DinB family protein [Nocardioidaceae bacterium]
MIDDAAKDDLYNYLKHERAAVLAKLDGLSEYDVRRPLTVTGTNLLGLVKHLATWEARYLGEVFGRPFPEPLPRWDVEAERLAAMWATERESRSDIVERYRRVWDHSDVTVDALTEDATGRVAWWQDAQVPLFNILVHLLAETSRHAGHADILREGLDGAVGTDAAGMAEERHDPAFWAVRREEIEAAARSASGPFH